MIVELSGESLVCQPSTKGGERLQSGVKVWSARGRETLASRSRGHALNSPCTERSGPIFECKG